MEYARSMTTGVGSTTGYSVSAPPMESGPSQIRDNITGGEQILSELHATIESLEKRLDTVLLPTAPQPSTTAPSTPQPVASHVRGRLTILNEGYIHATERLRELMRRIDV